MTRWFPPLTAVTAIVACGVVHGLWTDRWGLSAEPARSAAFLQQVPLSVTGWDGEVREMKDLTKVAGRVWLRYVQRGSGKTVNLLLVCDRPGPVSIHTPDVCYGASGYVMGPLTKHQAKEESAEFFTAVFRKSSASEQSNLRIFWAWNAGQGWQTADDPRTAFAGNPVLFKLYLIRELSQPNEALEGDASLDLMRQLLPELQRTLFQ